MSMVSQTRCPVRLNMFLYVRTCFSSVLGSISYTSVGFDEKGRKRAKKTSVPLKASASARTSRTARTAVPALDADGNGVMEGLDVPEVDMEGHAPHLEPYKQGRKRRPKRVINMAVSVIGDR
jgi:hypothetical protein